MDNYDRRGRRVPGDVLRKLRETVIADKRGRLLVVYHSTDTAFSNFERGDIGFPFGSMKQAEQAILAPFREKANKGEVVEISAIETAYRDAVGHSI